MEGQVLAGRYRLLSLLGQGGAGDVWRAQDLELDRLVAVKMLRRLDGDPVGAADRLRSEARAAAKLSHPNVVTTYDVGTTLDVVFLVMELVPGRDLAQLLRSDGLPSPDLVADIAVQAARALDAAHAAGIVHRDVKPGNLLLGPDGVLKITDFGISVAAGRSQVMTTMGGTPVLLGTAAYVAPEQVRGEPATAASDMYALGCVLYELLAGTPPFTGATLDEVLRQHLYAEPAPLWTVRPELAPGLAAAVMRLLAKDPAARPSSAAALLAVLNAAAAPAGPQPQHTQVLALPAEPPPDRTGALPGGPPGPKHSYGVVVEPDGGRRFPVLPVLAALAAVAVLAVVIFLFSGSPDRGTGAITTPGPAATKTTAKPKPSATPSRTPSRTPSATPSASPAATPVDDLHTLARLLRETRGRTGRMTRDAARDVDAAAEAYAAGDFEKARQKYQDARHRLRSAQEDGRWQPTPQIAALIVRLDRVFPAGDN